MSYNPATAYELQRILWRRSVMERGGTAWLTEKCREVKGKERKLGPQLESAFLEFQDDRR